ncbi:EAL domain-containing protein [Oricola sp.]|uniref:EAL domain-containing protein n=1 Tax=Oricola sp. TaxID=1979950 RepID=UPI0025EC08D2|nr:EAL domain-containing protein [Oricola sp.]MCI5075493.1 EAL domain-containing protein [Oricola sp.]
MKRGSITVASYLAIALAIVAPITLAILVAYERGLESAFDRAARYAQDALTRSETIADQTFGAFAELGADKQIAPCSEANIQKMRTFVLARRYLKTVGSMAGNWLVCSSLGEDMGGLYLGPPDIVLPTGLQVRKDVRLPFAGEETFQVFARGGFVAIVDLEQAVDVTVASGDVSIVAFVPSVGLPMAAVGSIRPEWFERSRDQGNGFFIDSDHVVAFSSSDRFDLGTIAAFPTVHLRDEVIATAWLAIPLGFFGASLLAYAVFQLAKTQVSLPSVIKAALRNKEFHLEYQPIVDLSDRKWVGAEVLLRWQRADGEIMRPETFISVAEETGLIRRITARVIELVEKDAGTLFAANPEFRLSINLSASDLQDECTPGLLSRLVKSTKAGPSNFVVEATERSFADPDIASKVYRELREAGIRIAIDDFGTGYSSLSSLEKFDLDFLKIDKTFIDTIGTDAATGHVIPHIVEIAKSLNLIMIAEGVETEPQLEFLRGLGVQYAQGWLFGKPMGVDELQRRMGVAPS